MRFYKIIGPLVLIITFYFLLLKPLFINPYLLRKKHEYKVGLIIRIEGSVEGDPMATYQYVVSNRVYRRSITIDGGRIVKVGDKFNVMYNPDNPKNAKILIDEPIR